MTREAIQSNIHASLFVAVGFIPVVIIFGSDCTVGYSTVEMFSLYRNLLLRYYSFGCGVVLSMITVHRVGIVLSYNTVVLECVFVDLVAMLDATVEIFVVVVVVEGSLFIHILNKIGFVSFSF